MKNLLIVGAGGHGEVVSEIAKAMKKYNTICFLDDNKAGEYILGHKVIGGIEDYKKLRKDSEEVIIAIGNNNLRMELLMEVLKAGYKVPILIHPTAVISSSCYIGIGSVVMPQAVINADSRVGRGSIINTGAIVEHDCIIGEGVHLSPKAALGGGVKVGSGSWIGLGASIINNINIGSNTVIAAGAVVVNDLPDDIVAMGVPAKIKS